jgi:hypothetical protein
MSEGLIKMYVTFITMGLMFFAVFGTIIARQKLSGIIQKIVLTIAFLCIILSGFLILLIVLNIPTV